MSSGWDSSSILACIKTYYSDTKIIPLILELWYGGNEPVNKFEIAKAEKICSFYNLDLKKVKIDYTKNNSLDLIIKSSKKMLFNYYLIMELTEQL